MGRDTKRSVLPARNQTPYSSIIFWLSQFVSWSDWMRSVSVCYQVGLSRFRQRTLLYYYNIIVLWYHIRVCYKCFEITIKLFYRFTNTQCTDIFAVHCIWLGSFIRFCVYFLLESHTQTELDQYTLSLWWGLRKSGHSPNRKLGSKFSKKRTVLQQKVILHQQVKHIFLIQDYHL